MSSGGVSHSLLVHDNPRTSADHAGADELARLKLLVANQQQEIAALKAQLKSSPAPAPAVAADSGRGSTDPTDVSTCCTPLHFCCCSDLRSMN